MMTSQATVIARDSSNFPIIIFPLLSSYFPTITARMHESIVLSRIDCMADWLVQVHTLNAFVVITKTLTTLYSSELHFWNSSCKIFEFSRMKYTSMGVVNEKSNTMG